MLLAIPCAALLGGPGLAAEDGPDPELMQDLSERTRSLHSRIALQDAPGGQEEARAVAALLERLAAFYASRAGGEEPASWSARGRALAVEADASLAAKDFGRAQGAASALSATCAGCHRVARGL
jgi:hypothetical protein